MAAALSLALCAGTVHAEVRAFDIPGEALPQALAAFEQQAGQRVEVNVQRLAGKSATPVNGSLEPMDALRQLLAGTGLTPVVREGRLAIEASVPMAGSAQTAELAPVTVTARRGAERAKDIPFSISVISGDDVESKRLLNLEDALRSTPGVDLNSWGGFNDSNIRIRGVGSMYQVSMDDSSVVMNLDGVPLSSRNASLATMDIERVEVLKGPQGTLFGRNSEAGALNVTSRRPTREREGYVRGEVGQEGQYLTEAAVGGPVSETVSARIAVRGAGADSAVTNSQNGEPVLKSKDRGVRGSVLWQPNAGTSVLMVGEHLEQSGRVGLMLMRPYGSRPIQDITPGALWAENTADRYSVEINHDLASSRITSLTSYSTNKFDQQAGADRLVAREVYGMPSEYLKQDQQRDRVIQQDLRLSSLPGAEVFWVTGLNFAQSKRSGDSQDPVTTRSANRDFETRSRAVYGEVTYPLTSELKLTGGLRHTWERKTYDAQFLGGGVITEVDRRRLEDNYSTGRVALSYAITPQTNVYGVVARGYKAGGFNDYSSQLADGDPYKPAKADSYEVGFKTESADRRFLLNGSVFWNKVKDDHLLGYDYTTFATKALNTDTESKGAELEGTWRVGGGWSLSGGVNFVDAKIKRSVTGASSGDVAAGNRVPDVPKWSAAMTVAYRQALPEFLGLSSPTLNSSLTYRFVGKRSADPQNHFDLGSYQKVDARVGVVSGNSEFYVWADNLLDKRYELYGYYLTANGTVGMPSRGRTVGIGFSHMF